MTALLTAWLALTLAIAAVALFAAWSRRNTLLRSLSVLALPIAAGVAFFAIQSGLTLPGTNPPPGKYQVLGARIDLDVAIYVLLNPENGEPRYYRLPYTTGDANDLQGAMDIAGEGGKPGAVIGEAGEAAFHAPPVTENAPKQAELPAYTGAQ